MVKFDIEGKLVDAAGGSDKRRIQTRFVIANQPDPDTNEADKPFEFAVVTLAVIRALAEGDPKIDAKTRTNGWRLVEKNEKSALWRFAYAQGSCDYWAPIPSHAVVIIDNLFLNLEGASNDECIGLARLDCVLGPQLHAFYFHPRVRDELSRNDQNRLSFEQMVDNELEAMVKKHCIRETILSGIITLPAR